jgi:hypothetical protein
MPRIARNRPVSTTQSPSIPEPAIDKAAAKRSARNRQVMAVKTLAAVKQLKPAEQAEFIEFALGGYATGIQGGAGRSFLHVSYEGPELRRAGIDYEPKGFDRSRAELPTEVKRALNSVVSRVGAKLPGAELSFVMAAGLINVVGEQVERWGFKLQTVFKNPDGNRIFAINYADGEGGLLPKSA